MEVTTINPAGEPKITPVAPAPERPDRDERVSIPVDPETALRGLMEAGPHGEPDAD